jgi:hypothetical protein
MKKVYTLFLLPLLIATACMSVVPAPIVNGSATVQATVIPTETKQSIIFTTETIEPCSFLAVTDTNIRECNSTACESVGLILAGETVEAACGSDEWARVRKGFVCIPALTGTGVCKR